MEHTTARGLRSNLINYSDDEFALFLRKAFIKGAGYSDDTLDRPVVGIVNTASDANPCHGNVPTLIDAVKRGVMLSGAFPVAFPTLSLHELFSYPTSMLMRNLMSMDTEEMIAALPVDAVVLIGGCDKTVPAQLMGAASANKPAIQLVTGSMLTGSHRGRTIGACTDCRANWGRYRSGEIDKEEIDDINGRLVGSVGTCSVAGTASTMACVTEALGMSLPGSATPPAVTADRVRIAEETGRRAVELAQEGLTVRDILTPKAFANAFRVLFAMSGSTNAVVHLTAVAGRVGYDVDMAALDRLSRETPVLVDLKPAGSHYMEDLHRAGGVPRLLHELRHLLHLDALTVSGKPLGEHLPPEKDLFEQKVISTTERPLHAPGSVIVLTGNLAPEGALLKQAAATPSLMEHRGRAVVFEDSDDLAARLDGEDLDVNADDVLVLRNIGPVGAPGMPEAGYIPIPKKLARQGVKDMVRISDGRMSGTAFGSVILHVAPEAAVGGALSLVRTGDYIELSASKGTIHLDVTDEELARRRQDHRPMKVVRPSRGYKKLYVDEVLQAPQGCDFGFLRYDVSRGSVPAKTSNGSVQPL
ncbi:dihydroxy-acid dehydratase [Rhodococcus sp. 06-621-2]|nr:dihydroxy-acid dehydratase [Rhodococcus sp. 06-621-2]OZC55544.1 dihydroxy-acid dehydratase [Rhodococcus sp. 06-621-2]